MAPPMPPSQSAPARGRRGAPSTGASDQLARAGKQGRVEDKRVAVSPARPRHATQPGNRASQGPGARAVPVVTAALLQDEHLVAAGRTQRCCLALLHNVAIVVLVPSRAWPSVLEARREDDCIGWDHEPCDHELECRRSAGGRVVNMRSRRAGETTTWKSRRADDKVRTPHVTCHAIVQVKALYTLGNLLTSPSVPMLRICE